MIRRADGKSEITAISNKYKNTLNDIIDSLDTEFPDLSRLIDKETHNTPNSRNTSLSLLEEDCLNKDILVTALERAPKIWDFQIYKCHDVALFGPKSEKT